MMREKVMCVVMSLIMASVWCANGKEQSDTIPQKKGFFARVMRYFDESNDEHPQKRFDVSVIGGPFYSSDAKLGLGVVSAGLYRMNGCEKDEQPSNVTLFGNVSTVGFCMIGLKGNNLFPNDRYRLNYTTYIYSFPSYYWGIGYDNENDDANKTKIDRLQARVKAEFLVRAADNLYVGPCVMWDYAKAGDVKVGALRLFDGMSLVQRNYGVGVSVQYDTRDYIYNASKGVYVYFGQEVRPLWMGNDMAFYTTSMSARAYKRVWKDGVLACDLNAVFNFGNPSWAMMAELGGASSMRGYYEGRYRDKHSMTVQVELRQRVWRRNGVVAWVGAGNVFRDRRTFRHILPNYGVGYRWEFKKRVNVRLDMGFGKGGQCGFVFNINEAF